MINVKSLKKVGIGEKTLYTLFFVALSVAIPEIVHLFGKISLSGTLSGEMLLPMHIPVMLAGFIAGPIVGGIVGFLSPAISYGLSGMPTVLMLPFMMIELCAYGVIAGLLSKIKINNLLKVIVVQIAGRALKAACILVAVFAFSYNSALLSSIYTAILNGLLGICLQLVIVPLLIEKFNKIV